MITPFDYHDDDDLHGSYQYVTLATIVNEFQRAQTDDDSIIKNVRRNRIIDCAKEVIRELSKNVLKDILAMEITVPDNLYFALPHDFVSYVRVSLVVEDTVTGGLHLQPLDVKRDINIADGYLQDNNALILFDEDGYILKADSQNTYNKPYKKYEFSPYPISGNRQLDTSKLSKFGEFKIDERRGEIVFSSNLADEEIVMEYLSDGLSFDTYNEEQIRVHKDALTAVKDGIYYCLIKWKDNVSRSDKYAALQRFKTTRHEAKLNRSGFDLLEIARTMNVSTKN
jgi:hypothetical protein